MAVKILNPSHPLHVTFVRFLAGKQPTKRQARKFLTKNQWAVKALEQDA